MYFLNGMKYNNSIILKSICNLFKNNVTLNVIGNNCESFKMIDFKFKKIKYSLKLLDMCNFIKGSLNDLTKKLIRDISIFDFVNSSILGGICIDSQNIANDKDGTISSCDIISLYPYVMSKKLPIGNYKFVKYFNRNRYLDSEYSCLSNCEIYTTDKVKNDSMLKQYPALISKTSVKYDDLSEFQRKNLKENYKSSEKLISHLGYDKNCYLSFDMYEMMISLGYKINVKKILEYKHSNFMKPYIDFLFEKKSYYKKMVILE